MKINVEKLEENSVHSGKRGPYTVNGHDWPYQFLAHCFHVMVRDYQVTETSLKTLEEKKTKLESIFNSALQAEFDIPFHAFCEEALEILRVHTVPTDASDGSNSTPTDDYVKSLSNSIEMNVGSQELKKRLRTLVQKSTHKNPTEEMIVLSEEYNGRSISETSPSQSQMQQLLQMLGSSHDPPIGPSHDPPSRGSSHDPPIGPSRDPPSRGPSRDPPSRGPSRAPSSRGPSRDPPSRGPSRDPPSRGSSHDPPSGTSPNVNVHQFLHRFLDSYPSMSTQNRGRGNITYPRKRLHA